MALRTSGVADVRYRWVILGVIYLSFLAVAVVIQCIPPVLSLMIDDVGLSHAQAGLLMSLIALPGVFLSIPAGMAADRYGTKNLIILCLAAMAIGSLTVAAGRSFPVLALGRLIAGAGQAGLFVIGAQVISQWFAGREIGVAIGVYSTAMPIGTIGSLNTLGALGKGSGWQVAVLIGVALCVVALILFVVMYKPAASTPTEQDGQPQPSPVAFMWHAGLPIWLLAAIWALFNAAVISFLTFGPDYFVAKGYGIEFAGFLASFLMLASPPLGPLVGHLVDRFGREELFIGLGGLLLAVGIFSVLSASSWLIFFLALVSLGAALLPTPVFALPPKMLKPQNVGMGYGIVSTCFNLGVVIGPYVTGLTRDVTGSYEVSFYLMASFSLLSAIVGGAVYFARRADARRSSGRRVRVTGGL